MVSPPPLANVSRIPESVMLRGVIVLLVIIPVAVMFWSIKKRVPMLNMEQEEVRRVYELETQISRFRASWSEAEARSIKAAWEKDKSMIPGDYEDIASWLERVNHLASLAGFSMTYQIGEIAKSTARIEDVSKAPVTIRLFAPYEMRTGEGRNKAYPSLLKFVHGVSESAFWVDLVGLNISGDGDGIKEAALSLEIWIGFAKGYSGTARLNASSGGLAERTG